MLIFIKDLGMQYPTEKSKTKRTMYLVECSGCHKQHKIQKAQFKAGYTEYCKFCSLKKQKGIL